MLSLLESTLSMGASEFAFTTDSVYCPDYRDRLQAEGGDLWPNDTPDNALSRFDLVRAALVGCEQEDDGILDKWYREDISSGRGVNLSVFAFNNTYPDTNLAGAYLENLSMEDPSTGGARRLSLQALEQRILLLSPTGFAPLSESLRNTASDMERFLYNNDCYYCSNLAVILIAAGGDLRVVADEIAFSQVDGPSNVPVDHPDPCYVPSVFHAYNGTNQQERLGIRFNWGSSTFWTNRTSGHCPSAAWNARYGDAGAEYLFGRPEWPVVNPSDGNIWQAPHDALSNVNGDQRIRTFTIGVKEPSAAHRRLLVDMARAGGGTYASATNEVAVQEALDNAILTANTAVNASFSAGATLGSGISSADDNFIYTASFRPSETGFWKGTINKYCLFETNASSIGTCYLSQLVNPPPGSPRYVKNPNPEDIWAPADASQVIAPGFSHGTINVPYLDGITVDSGTPPTQVDHGDAVSLSNSPSDVNSREIPTPKMNLSGTAKMLALKSMMRGDTHQQQLGYRRIFTWGIQDNRYTLLQDRFSNPRAEVSGDSVLSMRKENHLKHAGFVYGFPLQSYRGFANEPNTSMWWTQADTPEEGLALLRYSETCENADDQCYLVALSNAGLIHFFDAVTGEEIEAYYPPHFLDSRTTVNHRLADLADQPYHDGIKRFYMDGKVVLNHYDKNANGIIDSDLGPEGAEEAQLIAGFGRGGKGYILWEVGLDEQPDFTSGLSGMSSPNVRSSANEVGYQLSSSYQARPPHALMFDFENPFVHLGETWAKPWVGDMALSETSVLEVAVFPTEHSSETDASDFYMKPGANISRKLIGDTPTVSAAHQSSNCSGATGSAEFGIPARWCRTATLNQIAHEFEPSIPANENSECALCAGANDSLELASPSNGHTMSYTCTCGSECGDPVMNGIGIPCLESVVYSDVQHEPDIARTLAEKFYIESLYPFVMRSPTFRLQTGEELRAVRFRFDVRRLNDGDRLNVYDDSGDRIYTHLATDDGSIERTGWLYTSAFSFEIIGDGQMDAIGNQRSGRILRIVDIDYIREGLIEPVEWHPGVYVVSLKNWTNYLKYDEAREFPGAPGSGHMTILAQFTDDDCDGSDTKANVIAAAERITSGSVDADFHRKGYGEECYDKSDFPDLEYMTCPISADVQVYSPSGQFEAAYVGDECGQIWRIRKDRVAGGFQVKRILDLNSDLRGPFHSINLRKIFSKLQVVRTADCLGGVKTGIVFGTGNVQHPLASPWVGSERYGDNYLDGRRDVVGLVWEQPDSGPDSQTYALSDLYPAQTGPADMSDPSTKAALDVGWYFELERGEKSLRDPVVLDGETIFQTFDPHRYDDPTVSGSVSPCDPGTGRSFLYRMDMCNGDPRTAVVAERRSRTSGPPGNNPRRTDLNAQSNVGSNMEVFVSPKGERVLFAGDDSAGASAIGGTSAPQGVRLLYWRLE